MNVKKKGGLLKGGLKYISQIFEEEDESKDDFQIGLPTDVKHVAHIGWDGPSASAPAWMNEFKSAPLESTGGDADNNREKEKVKWVSEDKGKKAHHHASNSAGSLTTDRDLPALPRASRTRQPSSDSIDSVESPVGSPGSSQREIKRKDKGSNSKQSGRRRKDKSKKKDASGGGDEGTTTSLPNIPKRSRRKKSKDLDNGQIASSAKPSSKRGLAEDNSTALDEE